MAPRTKRLRKPIIITPEPQRPSLTPAPPDASGRRILPLPGSSRPDIGLQTGAPLPAMSRPPTQASRVPFVGEGYSETSRALRRAVVQRGQEKHSAWSKAFATRLILLMRAPAKMYHETHRLFERIGDPDMESLLKLASTEELETQCNQLKKELQDLKSSLNDPALQDKAALQRIVSELDAEMLNAATAVLSQLGLASEVVMDEVQEYIAHARYWRQRHSDTEVLMKEQLNTVQNLLRNAEYRAETAERKCNSLEGTEAGRSSELEELRSDLKSARKSAESAKDDFSRVNQQLKAQLELNQKQTQESNLLKQENARLQLEQQNASDLVFRKLDRVEDLMKKQILDSPSILTLLGSINDQVKWLKSDAGKRTAEFTTSLQNQQKRHDTALNVKQKALDNANRECGELQAMVKNIKISQPSLDALQKSNADLEKNCERLRGSNDKWRTIVKERNREMRNLVSNLARQTERANRAEQGFSKLQVTADNMYANFKVMQNEHDGMKSMLKTSAEINQISDEALAGQIKQARNTMEQTNATIQTFRDRTEQSLAAVDNQFAELANTLATHHQQYRSDSKGHDKAVAASIRKYMEDMKTLAATQTTQRQKDVLLVKQMCDYVIQSNKEVATGLEDQIEALNTTLETNFVSLAETNEKSFNDLSKKIDDQTDVNQAKNDEVIALMKDIQKSISKDLKEQKEETKATLADLEAVRAQRDHNLELLNTCRASHDELQAQALADQQQISALVADQDQAAARTNQLTEDISLLKTRITMLQDEVNKSSLEMINVMKRTMDNDERAKVDANSAMKQHEEIVKQCRIQLEQTQSKLEAMNAELSTAREDLRLCNQDLERQKELTEETKDLHGGTSAKLKALFAQCIEKDKELREEKSKSQEHIRKIGDLERQVSYLEINIKALQESISCSDNASEELRRRLTDVREEEPERARKQEDKHWEYTRREHQQQRNQIWASRDKIINLELELISKNSRIATLTREVDELKAKVANYTAQSLALARQADDLESANSKLTDAQQSADFYKAQDEKTFQWGVSCLEKQEQEVRENQKLQRQLDNLRNHCKDLLESSKTFRRNWHWYENWTVDALNRIGPLLHMKKMEKGNDLTAYLNTVQVRLEKELRKAASDAARVEQLIAETHALRSKSAMMAILSREYNTVCSQFKALDAQRQLQQVNFQLYREAAENLIKRLQPYADNAALAERTFKAFDQLRDIMKERYMAPQSPSP